MPSTDAIPSETELVALLIALRRTHPDMRIGQLICNVASWAGRTRPGGVWDLEDSEFFVAAHRHLYDNPCITAPAYVRVTIEPPSTNA
jgi:hypothetical protein